MDVAARLMNPPRLLLEGTGLVEEEGSGGVDDIVAQFIPGIALRENILRQAFRRIAAVGFCKASNTNNSCGTPSE